MKFKILLVILVIISCTDQKKSINSDLNYLPPNATALLKVHNHDQFKSGLKNNRFVQSLKKTTILADIRRKTVVLDSLQLTGEYTLAIYAVGKKEHDFLLYQTTDSISLGAADLKTGEALVYENHKIVPVEISGETLFLSTVGPNTFLGSSRLLLENVIRSNGKNKVSKILEKLFQTSDDTKSASLFVNLQQPSILSSNLKNPESVGLSILADWISVDFTMSQNTLLLNGVAKANDSVSRFLNLFDRTQPILDKTATLAPKNANGVLSFSITDYDTFLNNQKTFLDAASIKATKFNDVEEVGLIFLNENKAMVLHTLDNDTMVNELINLRTGITEYQESEIWQLRQNNYLTTLFEPLVADLTVNYYTVLDNAHVFCADQNTLKTIIANKRNQSTYDKNAAYGAVKAQLGNASNLFFCTDNQGLLYFLEEYFVSGIQKDLKMNDIGVALQFIEDEGFMHLNMIMTEIANKPVSNSVTPIFNLELDTDIATNPQFVKNHRTNMFEIVVQDQDNFLYLISSNGKVLWKKQLDGRIQGQIHQVDLYKNGKLQLAFTTNNEFLVLDRNGELVEPFRMKYEGGNVNPLAVFDYEKNRNYRFVVTQGRAVFMYDNQGKIVEGFTYTKAEDAITRPPKHFKIGQNDYLVFQLENGQLKIRHRAGGERIKVNRTIPFSNNEVFFYKNKFSVTDSKGILHQVDTRGKLSATNFNLSESHGMFATSKTLALMDDNTLNIKGKKVNLELGVYTSPKIFYINDKIYVTVTDIQNQKVYLFDSQAKMIPNFPVYGSSTIDLLDMDKDGKLELVAKDRDNSLIVYSLN